MHRHRARHGTNRRGRGARAPPAGAPVARAPVEPPHRGPLPRRPRPRCPAARAGAAGVAARPGAGTIPAHLRAGVCDPAPRPVARDRCGHLAVAAAHPDTTGRAAIRRGRSPWLHRRGHGERTPIRQRPAHHGLATALVDARTGLRRTRRPTRPAADPLGGRRRRRRRGRRHEGRTWDRQDLARHRDLGAAGSRGRTDPRRALQRRGGAPVRTLRRSAYPTRRRAARRRARRAWRAPCPPCRTAASPRGSARRKRSRKFGRLFRRRPLPVVRSRHRAPRLRHQA